MAHLDLSSIPASRNHEKYNHPSALSANNVAEDEQAVIQRVKSASVTVDGQLISTISRGLLVFAAVGKDDSLKEAESMASKVLKVKLWEDEQGGKWKKNVQEIDGEVLCGTPSTFPYPHHLRCISHPNL